MTITVVVLMVFSSLQSAAKLVPGGKGNFNSKWLAGGAPTNQVMQHSNPRSVDNRSCERHGLHPLAHASKR